MDQQNNNVNIVMENNEVVADYEEYAEEKEEMDESNKNERNSCQDDDQQELTILSSSVGTTTIHGMFERSDLSWSSRFRKERLQIVKERKITSSVPVDVFLIDLVYKGDLIGFVLLNGMPIIDFLASELHIGDENVRLPHYVWNTLIYRLRKRFQYNSVQEAFLKRILSIGCSSDIEFHNTFFMLTKFTLALHPEDFDQLYDGVVTYLSEGPVSVCDKSKGSVVKAQFVEVIVQDMEEIKALELCIYHKDLMYYKR